MLEKLREQIAEVTRFQHTNGLKVEDEILSFEIERDCPQKGFDK